MAELRSNVDNRTGINLVPAEGGPYRLMVSLGVPVRDRNHPIQLFEPFVGAVGHSEYQKVQAPDEPIVSQHVNQSGIAIENTGVETGGAMMYGDELKHLLSITQSSGFAYRPGTESTPGNVVKFVFAAEGTFDTSGKTGVEIKLSEFLTEFDDDAEFFIKLWFNRARDQTPATANIIVSKLTRHDMKGFAYKVKDGNLIEFVRD